MGVVVPVMQCGNKQDKEQHQMKNDVDWQQHTCGSLFRLNLEEAGGRRRFRCVQAKRLVWQRTREPKVGGTHGSEAVVRYIYPSVPIPGPPCRMSPSWALYEFCAAAIPLSASVSAVMWVPLVFMFQQEAEVWAGPRRLCFEAGCMFLARIPWSCGHQSCAVSP